MKEVEYEVSKKKPAKPIPEESYDRFKYRLEEKSSKFKERNITLFLLGVATGYRMQDLVCLTVGDIRVSIENGFFEIQESKQIKAWRTHKFKHPNSTQKEPKPRKHEIVPSLEVILKKFVQGRKASEYAFISNKGKGSQYIGEDSFSDILKEVANEPDINLKQITGHSLRKTYARRIYDATGSLEHVRIALGHKSIEVTKIYLGLEDEAKESAAKIAGSRL